METIIGLAHKMGMKAITEGIETPRELERLLEQGCEFGRGYYFSQPMQPKGALPFMRQHVVLARATSAGEVAYW